ncbi:hypothetical protein LWC34_01910 [Kibdelosporangium philippinense]|uniref:PPE family protein n=1 Tax=Kibdelosporangium philippinense TaxID=211113 RepID=A0ABS8Z3M0_9PSEU|nr:hypothetical protein [Kibdelosporangium philippinense]MCE7001603.1 hypothetical protein [Kibdelosporangium philippinense]
MAKYSYSEACEILESGQPYSLRAVGNAWRNFAAACRTAASHTKGTADEVTAQYGAPYQNFGARAVPIATWLETIAKQADTVAAGLSNAGDVGTAAQWTKSKQEHEFNARVDQIVGPEDALSGSRMAAIKRAEEQAAEVLSVEIDKWSQAYAAFNPGDVPPVPATNGGTGTTTSTGSTGTADSTGSTDAVRPVVGDPPPGSTDRPGTDNKELPGKTDFPESSVVGKDGGDFQGWVKDPTTGFLVDPGSGREFDPVSGKWIDPVTGKPFGDVTQYASRLEGLEGGVSTTGGLLGGFGGVTPALMTSGAVGSLYGGVVPPSLAAMNPAVAQLGAKAANDMAAKAFAAQQLGLREAAQGGRPFFPPMQAGGAGAEGGGARRTRARYLTEPSSTWGGQGKEEEKRKMVERPEWMVEDDVWSSGQPATRGILGED